MDNLYSIEELAFDVELTPNRVYVKIVEPEEAAGWAGFVETFRRVPSKRAVRKAMRKAYRWYRVGFRLDRLVNEFSGGK